MRHSLYNTCMNAHVSSNDNDTRTRKRKRVNVAFMQRIAHDDAQHNASRDDTLRATFTCKCDVCSHTYDANYVRVFAHVRAVDKRQHAMCERCLRIARDDNDVNTFMRVNGLMYA